MKRITYVLTIVTALAFQGCKESACEGNSVGGHEALSASSHVMAVTAAKDTIQPVAANISDVRPPDMKVRIQKGHALLLQTEGLQLAAVDTAVMHTGEYSVTSLNDDEMAVLPQGMKNMTATAAGYRLLPSGVHFSPYAELRVAYDPARLPAGYTPDDIYTSYYDTTAMTWVRLKRLYVDTANSEIVSVTTHFTDFINELVKAPEMPETQAFVPTAMQDIEAANPLDGITVIQPPTANPNGTANLEYPISIPAGRNGMQPNLALTYNSGGGNGWIGVGWDISIPCITIDTRWGVPRYDGDYESEIYCLNGEQLIAVSSGGEVKTMPHRTNQMEQRLPYGAHFVARTGDAHDSIIRLGDTPKNYRWLVYDRNGVRHSYGYYISTAIDNANTAVLASDGGNRGRWMLAESRDQYDNVVRYYYSIDTDGGDNPGKQIYLDSITYTGNGDSDGKYSVEFQRVNRDSNDIPSSCNLGFKEITDKVLCNIRVKYNDSIITGYLLQSECSYNSAYKTRLLQITKVDSANHGIDYFLNRTCIDHAITYNGYYGTVHRFSYHDMPQPQALFGVNKTSILYNDNITGNMLTYPFNIGSVTGSTALGLTRNCGWSLGGALTVGMGSDVFTSNNSIGGNYRHEKTASESLMAMVDIDGDGLADKVYQKNNNMYYRKMLIASDSTIVLGTQQLIPGGRNILREISRSNTFGVQASVMGFASGSVGWTSGTSTTAAYMADVDGDGLADIVDEGQVYFNRLDTDGHPSFAKFVSSQSGNNPGGSNVLVQNQCRDIIFDGTVDDSIDCVYKWKNVYKNKIKINDSSDLQYLHQFYPEDEYLYVIDTLNNYSALVRIFQRTLDCSGVASIAPSIEAVRVWVAPYSGDVTVKTHVVLVEDSTENRRMARHADGVTYTVQHTTVSLYNSYNIYGTVFDDIKRQYISPNNYGNSFNGVDYDSTYYFTVNEGDLIFFRLQSGDNSRFDKVIDNIEIDIDGVKYTNDGSYILSGNRYIQMPDTCHYELFGDFSVPSGINYNVVGINGTTFPNNNSILASGNDSSHSSLKIILSGSGNELWSSVECHPQLALWLDSLSDPVTVYLPIQADIDNSNTPAWERPIYRRLFGPLYHGWGQFAYSIHDVLHANDPIEVAMLIPPDAIIADSVGDTNGMYAATHRTIDSADFNMPSYNDFQIRNGSVYCPIGVDTRWVEMQPDPEHDRWMAYGGGCYVWKNGMSNAMQYDIPGNYTNPPIFSAAATEPEYDESVPAPDADGTPAKAIRKVRSSDNVGLSFGIEAYGASYGNGANDIETDYIDLNGDRYPDIVGREYVQYRQIWGGLGESRRIWDNVKETGKNTTWSSGVSFGASTSPNVAEQTQTIGSAKFHLRNDGSGGGNFSYGHNAAASVWIDINGDGLPDRVSDDGQVNLNIGYDFLAGEDWNFNDVQTGQSASASINASFLSKYNVAQGSVQAGAGLSMSVSRTSHCMADINGDGLPDRVWRDLYDIDINDWDDILHPIDSAHVQLNLGGGRWSETMDLNIKEFNQSSSFNESLDAGVTLGATLFGFKVTGGLNGSPYSGGTNRDILQLVDINGDGWADLVSSEAENQINVQYNLGGKTNLLRAVHSSLGTSTEIEYTLSVPDVHQPTRGWQMTKVEVTDSLNPNGGGKSVIKYSYHEPFHDRYERMSYGYGKIVAHYVNPDNDSVCRIVERNYYNRDLHRHGNLRRELTMDSSGRWYIERLHTYNYIDYSSGDTVDFNADCPILSYPVREAWITRHYEGRDTAMFTAVERYEYDRYHNVVRYYDDGDSAYFGDGLVVEMDYYTGRPSNLVGLMKEYRVFCTGDTTTMRKAKFEYNNKGKLQHQSVYYSHFGKSDYDFSYDIRGNLALWLMPVNDSGQRMHYQYEYDSIVQSHVTIISNSFGDSTLTEYNYRFGKPTKVTDVCGNNIRYSYDFAGRLISVTSPLNQSGMPTIVNSYYPKGYCHNNAPVSPSGHSYSRTKHYDDNGSLVTETAVIADGLGRVLQTKKGLSVVGTPKMQVSGRYFTDALGRTIKQYDPVVEDTTVHSGLFNPLYDTSSLTATQYDVLDRTTHVRRPLGVETSSIYTVAEDNAGRRRFLTIITDPNGNDTWQYTDYEGRKVQITDAAGGVTSLVYDNLGQLARSIDPEGFPTRYYYDMQGRLIYRNHPDAGESEYAYDPAGNLVCETNSIGRIRYVYWFNRLTNKHYSELSENDVTYHYGTDGNRRGRVFLVEDGSGAKLIDYDALGNVVSEDRIVEIPYSTYSCRFFSKYFYDSWGRMDSILYPDGETVRYHYTFGGDLQSVYGEKGASTTQYADDIMYNIFGKRQSISYDNGTFAEYQYDKLQRLHSLTSVSATNDTMQKIIYTYDFNSNVVNVDNYAGLASGIGGPYSTMYYYDELNRLCSSYGNGLAGNFSQKTEYSPSGRMVMNDSRAMSASVQLENVLFFGYCNRQRPHAPKLLEDRLTMGQHYLLWDGCGNLGLVNNISDDGSNDPRFLFWTEDSRLHTVADGKHYSYYTYDHEGNRTLKITGDNNVMDINADEIYTAAILDNMTVYPSPYLVLTNRSYTKHYYIGSDRLCARIGNGSGSLVPILQNNNFTEKATALFNHTILVNDHRILRDEDTACIASYSTDTMHVQAHKPSSGQLFSKTEIDPSGFIHDVSLFENEIEDGWDIYFYHSDHLGSASWITDRDGTPVQHLQYLPYGMRFVDQRNSGYSERFTFTGKERDEETGYGYLPRQARQAHHGARYMDHELMTMWLSVDPID